MKKKFTDNKWEIIKTMSIHISISIGIFYFIFHPLTMVVYWYEFTKTEFTYTTFKDALFHRLAHSFTFEMVGMAIIFILLGLITGLVLGIYYLRLSRKNKEIKRQEGQLQKDIISVIKNGENDRVEFKSSLRYDFYRKSANIDLETVVLKTIAGFLNATGGRLIIGVDDESKIIGLEYDYISLKKKDKDGFELKLFELITNQIGPEFCTFIQVYFYTIEEKEICVIEIENSKVPAYLTQNKDLVFFLRIGNSTKPLSVKQAIDYLNM